MLTKYKFLDSTQIPLETSLFNSCKYDFKFKLGSKMSLKHLTWLSDLTEIIIRGTMIQLVRYSSLWENGIPQNWFFNVQRQVVGIK